MLPFAAIATARALCGAADLLPRAWGERLLLPVATLLLLTPMLATARTEATERRHDTRQIASAWLRQHAPAGRSVLIEHGGFDLLQGPWRLRFPLGSAGCVDIDDMLGGRMGYSEVVDDVTRLFRSQRKDEAAAVIPDELVDDAVIVGDLDYVRKQVGVWEAAGVTMMVVSGRSPEQVAELAELV